SCPRIEGKLVPEQPTAGARGGAVAMEEGGSLDPAETAAQEEGSAGEHRSPGVNEPSGVTVDEASHVWAQESSGEKCSGRVRIRRGEEGDNCVRQVACGPMHYMVVLEDGVLLTYDYREGRQ
ncbi:unnamed protein product, partial [Discosporangium mesarthrocarpum]